jgi:hypothetical protein
MLTKRKNRWISPESSKTLTRRRLQYSKNGWEKKLLEIAAMAFGKKERILKFKYTDRFF